MLFSILNLDCYKNADYFKLTKFLRENMDLSYVIRQADKNTETDEKWFDYKIKISCFKHIVCINLKQPYPRIYGFEIEKIDNLNTIVTRIYPLI
jgi:hypothetical protein